MKKSFVYTMVAVFFAAILGTFAGSALAQDSSTWNQYQQRNVVETAVVIQVRDVKISTERPGAVASVAAPALGGIFGAALGRNAGWQVQAATAGIGAAVGTQVAKAMAQEAGQEIVLKLASGSVIAVSQSVADGVRFVAGQKVVIIGNGRIVPDSGPM
jgi:outer membrane lipoprotein SlyB